MALFALLRLFLLWSFVLRIWKRYRRFVAFRHFCRKVPAATGRSVSPSICAFKTHIKPGSRRMRDYPRAALKYRISPGAFYYPAPSMYSGLLKGIMPSDINNVTMAYRLNRYPYCRGMVSTHTLNPYSIRAASSSSTPAHLSHSWTKERRSASI